MRIASSLADADEVLHHRVEVAVVDDRARPGAVEDVGRDRVIAGGREPPGHVLDVRVDAERLLDDDDRAARLAVGKGLVQPHRTVGGLTCCSPVRRSSYDSSRVTVTLADGDACGPGGAVAANDQPSSIMP